MIDRLLIGEALVVEAEQSVRTGVDGDVDAGLAEQLPCLPGDTGAVVEDVVGAKYAGLGEFRAELGQVANELGQDAHVVAARDLPPVEIELRSEANADQVIALVPVDSETLQVARQMGGGRLL